MGWFRFAFADNRASTLQSSVLPVLSGWVLVLLKLLLATVTASANSAQPPSAGGQFPPGMPSRRSRAEWVEWLLTMT